MLPAWQLNAQRKYDMGIFAGTSYYLGDINPGLPFYSPSLAVGPIVRYNFHTMSSLRLSAVYHKLDGNDLDFSDPFQVNRAASFSGTYVDLAAMYELNFQPYKTANRKLKYTYYTAVGLGYNLVLGSTAVSSSPQLSMPFSAGVKFNAGKRLSAGAEFSPRKLFNDKIDGVSNISTEDRNSLFGNKDWYTFAGVFFTYKIFNLREDCPAYD
jgi:hypothetical protein